MGLLEGCSIVIKPQSELRDSLLQVLSVSVSEQLVTVMCEQGVTVIIYHHCIWDGR